MNFGGLISRSFSSASGGGGSRIVGDIVSNSNAMPTGAFIQPSALIQSTSKSPNLSLSIKGKMEGHSDMLLGDHFDSSLVGRIRDDGYESRSGSENFEVASGDDQEAGDDQRTRKKKYHRHTPEQIQELESFFKECPHPDEKQRLDLSKRLGLETKQIKFWFQNRRTQMKTQLERHENVILRQENDKLRAENELLKHNMADPSCNHCGGPVLPGPVSFEQQQLRIENARLKDELNRVCILAHKFLGRPVSSLLGQAAAFDPNSNLDLSVGRNGFGNLGNMESALPMGLDHNNGVTMALVKPMTDAVGNEVPYDRSVFLDLAMAAMEELVKLAQIDTHFWIKSYDGEKEALNLEQYRAVFPPCIGMRPSNLVTEATRETGIILINSSVLVEALMDANRWADMFPGLVARAATVDVISNGVGGTRNGALLVMQAEIQVVSPFVPVRQVNFLRFCKQHAEGVWAVVDVSVDANQESFIPHPFTTCRRLPSGCLLQDMSNGCCKVTWVEHSEYDESIVHQLYRSVIPSGKAFGAPRWIASLQRYWETMAMMMTPTISNEDQTVMNLSGKKSMLRLAQRMVENFCSGVCGSSFRKWDKLLVGNLSEDVKILTRKNVNDPGEPSGILLSASTSVWLPITRKKLFNFLRDERSRSDWDILSHGGLMHETIQIPKGQAPGNCVSLLRANRAVTNGASDNTMLILQETWNDATGSLIVYAPVDSQSMKMVMSGGESTYVALLPSGFVILPDDSYSNGGLNNGNGGLVKRDGNSSDGHGSLLTVGFQILVNNLPTAKITVESVETVNNLISCTIQRIKAALQLT